MTLADTDKMLTSHDVLRKLEVVEKPVDKAESAKYLELAERYAASHANDPLLVAIRYFEVGDRFKETPEGMRAIAASLTAMQKISAGSTVAEYRPAPTDSKVYVQSDPPGAAIILVSDTSRQNTMKKTPALVQLPKGKQTLSIELAGMKPATLSVDVGETVQKPEPVKLMPLTARVDVLFESGWLIFADGQALRDAAGKQLTTPSTVEIPLGNHTIVIAKDGFSDLQQRVAVKDALAPMVVEMKGRPSAGTSLTLSVIQQEKKRAVEELENWLAGTWDKDGRDKLIISRDHTMSYGGKGTWEAVGAKEFVLHFATWPVARCNVIDADSFTEGHGIIWKRVKK